MPISEPGKADHVCASCVICGQWPSTLREAMRCAIDALPLQGQVCDGCFEAFWGNVTDKVSAKRQKPKA